MIRQIADGPQKISCLSTQGSPDGRQAGTLSPS